MGVREKDTDLEGREAQLQPDDRQPAGGAGITIEQFVKELRKRKKAKEAKQKANQKTNQKANQTVKNKNKKATGQTKKTANRKKKQIAKGIKKNTANRKKKQSAPGSKIKPGIKSSPNKNPKPVQKKKEKRPLSKKKPAITVKQQKNKPSFKRKPTLSVKPQLTKPERTTSKPKKNVPSKKFPKSKKHKAPKTPRLKPTTVPPRTTTTTQAPKRKPSRAKKPVQRQKKKVIKQEAPEDDDPFNFGGSNAQEHSDHHIHHHDHLEAHKHHHKHKEDHAHDHAHANDHVHNHKHTHNHVHNHIHKHNEAHEHKAEHAHTEKHTHKHLEYIDQGGWRRRDAEANPIDPFSGEMLIPEVTSPLVLQEREGRTPENPRGAVKNELQKFIQSYQAYSSDSKEATPAAANAAPYEDIIKMEEGLPAFHTPDSRTNSGTEVSRSNPAETYKEMEEPNATAALASPLEGLSKAPVEVEEISYEEYVRLQKLGPTFEEEVDYEDYHEQKSNSFDDGYNGYESGEESNYGSYNGYDNSDERNYASYNRPDQVGHGTEEHLVMPEYEGDWVDMEMDLQYDLGPEYLDYTELDRRLGGNFSLEGRSLPGYEDDDAIDKDRSLPNYDGYDPNEESLGRNIPSYSDYIPNEESLGRSLPSYDDYDEYENLEGRNLQYDDYAETGIMPGNVDSINDEYQIENIEERNLPSYDDYNSDYNEFIMNYNESDYNEDENSWNVVQPNQQVDSTNFLIYDNAEVENQSPEYDYKAPQEETDSLDERSNEKPGREEMSYVDYSEEQSLPEASLETNKALQIPFLESLDYQNFL